MDPYFDHRGTRQLPPAYRAMFENDPHPPGSVDREIWNEMVRVGPITAVDLYRNFTPTEVTYAAGMRPELERIVRGLSPASGTVEGRVAEVVRFASELAPAVSVALEQMKFGGSEEEIIARGSDWCTDVARVTAALLQVARIPARLVILEDVDRAYGGHSVVEAWRGGVWGTVDPCANVVFRQEDGLPASTWELMNRPELLDAHPRPGGSAAEMRDQYRWAAIANYVLGPRDAVDYSVGPINQYHRTILTQSDEGWPGGRRWLFGEDHSHERRP